MLEPAVLAALVALVKVIFDKYLPQFPVSDELIYAVIVVLLGLFGLELVQLGVANFLPEYRGLLGA